LQTKGAWVLETVCCRGITSLFEQREEEEMLTLSTRELAVLFDAQRESEIYLVEVVTGAESQWEMEVKLPGQDKVYRVQTFRGQIKTWKHLNSAVSFIKETCPQAEMFHVVLAKATS
jgi:hypothetical protein